MHPGLMTSVFLHGTHVSNALEVRCHRGASLVARGARQNENSVRGTIVKDVLRTVTRDGIILVLLRLY